MRRKKNFIPVHVCGEIASNEKMLPFLIAAGVDEPKRYATQRSAGEIYCGENGERAMRIVAGISIIDL
ncbi:Uncharacterised protein [Raoultella terrigena]|uniref:Phosphoenolpyruvate-protein phosphotransferase n=1 Tax=Raoultella terrigena TaxID=577 RepID=A0A3P8KNP0_RAOTE|nr:Uncharacterised protein [Raoultella terrigena]